MKKLFVLSPFHLQRIRRNWLVLALLMLGGLTLIAGAPAWAASGPVERNQTVPAPTPTSATQPPTPTPKKDKDDDDAPPPTATPDQAPPQEPPTGPVLSGVVVAEALNVRSGPGTSFPVIGKLVNNERVEILYRDQVGAWWQICCIQPGDQRGWASASLIRPDFDPAQANQLIPVAPELPTPLPPTPISPAPSTPAATTAISPTPQVAVTTTPTGSGPTSSDLSAAVNAERLNMRSGPGTDFEIVAKLERNQIVNVLARNERGDWWFVCCATDAATRGWVSAPYLTPDFDSTAANQLLPLFSNSEPATAPASPITQTQIVTVAAALPASGRTELSAQMALNPPFALQGEQTQIVITVTNSGLMTATNVVVRDELNPSLAFVKGEASDSGVAEDETLGGGPTVITFSWNEIGPGAQAIAAITIQIAADLPDGSVVDNLAAVSADNAGDATTGIVIGMPPAAPPDFR